MNSLYLIRFFFCSIGVLSTLIIFFSICCCSYLRLKGSLSKGVFERRTSTGSEVFFIFKPLDATKFVFPSVFTIIETICPKLCAKTPSKNEKKDHFRLTCVAQKRLCISSLICNAYFNIITRIIVK